MPSEHESNQQMPSDESLSGSDQSNGATFVPSDNLTDEEMPTDEEEANDNRFELENFDEVKKAVKKLAEKLGLNRLFEHPTTTFDDLAEKTKLKKAYGIYTLHRAIYAVIAPSNPTALKSLVETKYVIPKSVSSNYTDEILGIVAKNYESALTPQTRKAALSIVSPFMNFAQVQRFIPNLSINTFKASKYILSIDEQTKKDGWITRKQKFSTEAVTNFIQFICAPEFIIDLPFGSDTLKLSNNETINVAKVIQTQCQSEIIRLYRSSIAESGDASLALSTSSCVRILDVLPIKSSKSAKCVDYFIADGESGKI